MNYTSNHDLTQTAGTDAGVARTWLCKQHEPLDKFYSKTGRGLDPDVKWFTYYASVSRVVLAAFPHPLLLVIEVLSQNVQCYHHSTFSEWMHQWPPPQQQCGPHLSITTEY